MTSMTSAVSSATFQQASSSSASSSKVSDISEVEAWTGKKFGELRGFRTIDNEIRILSHTGGFAIFLPEKIWRPLDHQVPIFFPKNMHSSCWIADEGSAFLKVDVTPSRLDDSYKDYASADLDVALDKIESFVKKNFFSNPQAYPDSDYFSHGSIKDDPSEFRPFRWRLGGNFQYQF